MKVAWRLFVMHMGMSRMLDRLAKWNKRLYLIVAHFSLLTQRPILWLRRQEERR